MIDYLDGETHEWAGGECPVPPYTIVHIWLRRPVGWHDTEQVADQCAWDHDDDPADIVRFRVVKP